MSSKDQVAEGLSAMAYEAISQLLHYRPGTLPDEVLPCLVELIIHDFYFRMAAEDELRGRGVDRAEFRGVVMGLAGSALALLRAMRREEMS